jgi:hypothetical protein
MSFTATFTRVRGRELPPPQPADGPCMDQQDNDGEGAIDDRDPTAIARAAEASGEWARRERYRVARRA